MTHLELKHTPPANNLQEQGRTPKGHFAKGYAQNPQGRSVGSRNKATQAALILLVGEAEALIVKLWTWL